MEDNEQTTQNEQTVLPFPDIEAAENVDGDFYATLPLMELAGLMADSQFLRILFENGLEDWEEFETCLSEFKEIEGDEPQLFN